MNYQQVKIINGVRSFDLLESGELILILKDNGLYINDRLAMNDVDTFYTYKNKLICIKNSQTVFFRKVENNYIEEFVVDRSIIYQSTSDENAVFSSELDLNDFTLKYEVIDFYNQEVIYELGRLPITKGVFRHEDFFIICNKEKIGCLNLESQKIEWEIKLDPLKMDRVLDIYQTQLLVACSDHLLLSVDVNSGEILRKWQELPGFEAGQSYKDVLPEPADFVLDKEAGKLIGVFSKFYFEIDIESGEISYEDIRQELNTHHINSFRRMGNNPFTKDHLFVTAHAELDERPNVDLDCLLALNRNTKKVDWVHIFKDTGLGTNVPQITSNHLYQLDTEKNLYVFERTA